MTHSVYQVFIKAGVVFSLNEAGNSNKNPGSTPEAGMSNASWGLNKLFQAIVQTRGLAEGVKAPQKANPMLFVFQVII